MAQCTLQFIYNKTFIDDDDDDNGDALVTTAATSDGAFDVDGDDKCKSKHPCLVNTIQHILIVGRLNRVN